MKDAIEKRKRKIDARTIARWITQGLDVEHYVRTGELIFKRDHE